MSRWHRLPKCITQHVREPSFSNMHKQRTRVESGSNRSECEMACPFIFHSSNRTRDFVLFWLTHHMVLLADSVIQKIPLSHQKQENKNKNKNSSCPTPHHQTTYLLYHYYTKKLLSQCCPKQLMLEESIISLSLSSLGFLRGKNKFSSSYNACHDFSRYIPSFSSTSSTSSSNLFNHTSIQHLPSHPPRPRPSQLHPSSPKHKKSKNPINSSNSHNSPPNLYTAVHTPVHNASATPTLPSLHNTAHTTPRDPPSPLWHFDQI